jgi:hypothetical protein
MSNHNVTLFLKFVPSFPVFLKTFSTEFCKHLSSLSPPPPLAYVLIYPNFIIPTTTGDQYILYFLCAVQHPTFLTFFGTFKYKYFLFCLFSNDCNLQLYHILHLFFLALFTSLWCRTSALCIGIFSK